MINPDAEVMRLRAYLGSQGWYPQEIDDICDLAYADINEVMLDVVSNAVATATEHAEELGAFEFIDEMDVIEIGSGFMVSTISGRTDYSTPEHQMLPDLLRGGKVSEDGSRYRVIPIGGDRTSTTPKNIFATMQQQQLDQSEARASLIENNMDKRSARAQQMASHFRDLINRRRGSSENKRSNSRSSGDVQFRTASDKQDATTQWVQPAVDMDMTEFLMDLNRGIEETLHESIILIIQTYEKEFT